MLVEYKVLDLSVEYLDEVENSLNENGKNGWLLCQIEEHPPSEGTPKTASFYMERATPSIPYEYKTFYERLEPRDLKDFLNNEGKEEWQLCQFKKTLIPEDSRDYYRFYMARALDPTLLEKESHLTIAAE